MKILVVDNFDSFTNNLIHYIKSISQDIDVTVVRNDNYGFLSKDEYTTFDAILISPGPGNVNNAQDIGICAPILKSEKRPIFGVCLGHQAIASASGARVVKAPTPIHGQVWEIQHNATDLFRGLPNPFGATRYHSWIVESELPEDLCATAWADGVVMGLEHRHLPRWGVQFHPEAIGTTEGKNIIKNFVSLARCAATVKAETPPPNKQINLHWQSLGPAINPIALVEATRTAGVPSLLLDSSMLQEEVSRFSYVAVSIGLGDETLAYDQFREVTTVTSESGQYKEVNGDIFDILKDSTTVKVNEIGGAIPFDFKGGAIGWLGYELKSKCNEITSPQLPDYPTAVFRLCHSYFIIDHVEDATYAAVCIPSEAEECPRTAISKLDDLLHEAKATSIAPITPNFYQEQVLFHPRHSDDAYLALIQQCRQKICDGESYELCLTNIIKTNTNIDPWMFYCTLRDQNPAPYAAYLEMGGVTVASSSPERFLKIDAAGWMEAKPIKGTIRRGGIQQEDAELIEQLRTDKKECAENMMIVDLLRHDLSKIAQIGTVCVKRLNDIETFPTVHQMVSTICGKLREEFHAIDAIRACFPGGSMTGAPKLRSMEILDQLEAGPRGVYSGALGWVGFDGQIDLSIVIRTAVFHRGVVAVGCGGAITYLSNPESELDEIKLKSYAMGRAISTTVTGSAANFHWAKDGLATKDSGIRISSQRTFPNSRAKSVSSIKSRHKQNLQSSLEENT